MFSNVTLLFFILLIPLAGFIAWAGDYIGHRTGKKRQSLWGLRPRHTALVFTIASGMAIVCVSFGIFWLVSESFRVIVRDGEQLYRNNQGLREENKRQAVDIARASSRLAALKAEAEQLGKEREAAEKARNTAVANAGDADKKRQTAESKRAEAESLQKLAQDKYRRAESDLNSARADLAGTRRSLLTTEAYLSRSQKDLMEKAARVKTAEDELKTAAREVNDAGTRVSQARAEQKKAESAATEAKAAVAKAEGEVLLVRDELKTQRKQLAALQKEFNDQKNLYAKVREETKAQRVKLEDVTAELATKQEEYAKLVANTAALRGSQITYQVGEEIDRITLKPGMNVWRIQYALESFLVAAAKKAESRGAARGAQVRSVLVAPKLLAYASTEGGGPGPRLSTEADTLQAAAAAIREKNQETLVRAVVTTNAVLGEPVIVELRVDTNPVVLKKDARIGEIILNGEKSRQEIADAVYTFLSRDIHKKLLAAGMLPPSRGAEDTLGEFYLTGEEWFRLIDDIRKGGSRPKLTVHAARDLRAGDAIQLRFSVRTTVPWKNPPPID